MIVKLDCGISPAILSYPRVPSRLSPHCMRVVNCSPLYMRPLAVYYTASRRVKLDCGISPAILSYPRVPSRISSHCMRVVNCSPLYMCPLAVYYTAPRRRV
uniref:Uncharacterized protein n=1 Tax=Ascaris lumbricoides TaxID=6252 RepID=A0A0M3HYM0_ASCLU